MGKYGMSTAVAAVTALGAMVALAAPASAGQARAGQAASGPAVSKTVQFGPCHNSGAFAYCSSSGTVSHPLSIQFHIVAAPGQKVEGSWAMDCTKGKHGGHTGGQVKGRAPQVKPLKMPFKAPDSCNVAANAQLTKKGKIRTFLEATISG
jgi:hypothetical protein